MTYMHHHMQPVTHDLKVERNHFIALSGGIKPFECRIDDRCYAPGDRLWLREFDEMKKRSLVEEERRKERLAIGDDRPIPIERLNQITRQAIAQSYTGRQLLMEVTHVQYGEQYGIMRGYCVLGLRWLEFTNGEDGIILATPDQLQEARFIVRERELERRQEELRKGRGWVVEPLEGE